MSNKNNDLFISLPSDSANPVLNLYIDQAMVLDEESSSDKVR